VRRSISVQTLTSFKEAQAQVSVDKAVTVLSR